MTAPVDAFTSITSGQVDPDSPLDTTLMAALRTNDDHLREVLYGLNAGTYFTPQIGHDHDGTNSRKVGAGSITQTSIGANAVGVGELKTASGEVSTTSTREPLILPGGTFGFYPLIRMSTTSSSRWLANIVAHNVSNGQGGSPQVGWTGSIASIQLGNNNGFTIWAFQAYVTASPPYKVGNVIWNHFMFLLREIETGKVVSAYEAPCPPWQNNGKTWLPKDHKDRLEAVPHPFVDYWQKDPADSGLEIVLVDLNDVDVKSWKEDNEQKGKSMLADLHAVLPGKGISHHVKDIGVPDIAGFSEKVKMVTP